MTNQQLLDLVERSGLDGQLLELNGLTRVLVSSDEQLGDLQLERLLGVGRDLMTVPLEGSPLHGSVLVQGSDS